ncbi:hypothetical protein AB1Y20_015744 [Prymnesium parvum]|uniref:Uncharacterized protein n=1 Tax=Prymnesium parvum TaxID=97485 RepID=A0AB34JZF3_PRYPA
MGLVRKFALRTMVLSVPPLLEELGTNVTKDVTHALAVWQRALWGAAQRLRERPGQPDGVQRRWMGTTEQLSSVIAGSVVLGGDDTAPDVVPLSTATTPAVKGSPHGPLVRLEGAPGLSGRYASLPKIIGSSVGVWPAAITAGSNGGRNAGLDTSIA